jgi:hypothetical protein
VLGADQLDAIALVAKSSSTRLSATQRYIFNAIFGIFGKDVVENVLTMATFADAGPPQLIPVLA